MHPSRSLLTPTMAALAAVASLTAACSRQDAPPSASPAAETPRPAAPVVSGPARPVDQPAPLSAVPPCRSNPLRLTNEGGDAGMGNRVAVLGLENTGPAACTLTGYPNVSLLDEKGRSLAEVRSERSQGNYFNAGTTPTTVTVEPGDKAYFDLAWNVVPHEGEGETVCPTAAVIRVGAPGDGALIGLEQSFTPCGGRVRVGPIRPTAGDAPPAT